MPGFLPDWPITLPALMWLALALILAGLSGELAHRVFRLPRITGYILTGLLGSVLGLGERTALSQSSLRPVIDLALAFLLFDLGTRVNLRWLRHNPALALNSLLESLIGATVVALLLMALGLDTSAALIVAALSMATSPAIVVRVVTEMRATGQVTERLQTLAALNSLYAIITVKLASAGLALIEGGPSALAWLGPIYLLAGSILVALLLARTITTLNRRTDLREDNGLLLLLGSLLFALALAEVLRLSPLLVPLLAGMSLSLSSDRSRAWPAHFGLAGSVLAALLFLASGLSIAPAALLTAGIAAVVLIAGRLLGKLLPTLLLARKSGLSYRQALALGLALTPMSGIAFVLAADFMSDFPESGARVGEIALASLCILEIVGPIVLQRMLVWTGEAKSTAERSGGQP